jgi:hypothetical protein
MVHKTKKNTEKLATYGTQDEEKHRKNWQHMVHKTKKNTEKLATYGTQDEENKAKTQYHLCWTPLCTNKHK